jgi:hypothetical protein
MPKGSIAIFHEYGHYETWRFFPRLPMQERFREHVIATWRESGGEPDGALQLPGLLGENGFVIRSARPHIFCLRPSDYMWQWPATFIETYLERLIEMGRIDHKFAEEVRTASRARRKIRMPGCSHRWCWKSSRKNCNPGSAMTLRRGPAALHHLSARR